MNKVKVSVLVPTYNSKYIAETLDSIKNQTYVDYEVIIVDNLSTDNTIQIIDPYLQDERFKLYINECNIGAINNFNKALNYAKGEYIKYLFSDDLLYPNALERFVLTLEENPEVSLVTSYYNFFGTRNYIFRQPFINRINGNKAIKESLLYNNWIGAPSNVIFRRNCCDWGGFSLKWGWWIDLEFWHKLLLKHDLFVLPELLSQFRYHEASVTNNALENFDNLHDEYFYLKSLQGNFNYSFLNNDREFYETLKKNARNWVNLIPLFTRNKRYDLLKKAIYVLINEGLIMEYIVKYLKNIFHKTCAIIHH